MKQSLIEDNKQDQPLLNEAAGLIKSFLVTPELSWHASVQPALAELALRMKKCERNTFCAVLKIVDAWLFNCLPPMIRYKGISALVTHTILGHDVHFTHEFESTCMLLPLYGKSIYYNISSLCAEEGILADESEQDNITQFKNSENHFLMSVDDVLNSVATYPPLRRELFNIITIEQILQKIRVIDQEGFVETNQQTMLDSLEQIGDVYAQCSDCKISTFYRESASNAFKFYSAALKFLHNSKDEVAQATYEASYARIQHKVRTLYNSMLSTLNPSYIPKKTSQRKKSKLATIKKYRDTIKAHFNTLTQGVADTDQMLIKRAEALQQFYQDLTSFMKIFVASFFESAINELGDPPCEHALIGFGSLAKETVTPFSDIEFGILIRDDNESNRMYFRNLTFVVEFKIIQLLETPIPTNLLNYNFDHITGAGICFDLGGKHSLGRRHDSENSEQRNYGQLKYELIGSVDSILRYIENEYFLTDKLLPIEVGQCTHISGAVGLTRQYQENLKRRFSQCNERGIPFYQERAITFLCGYKRAGKQILTGDLDVYSLNCLIDNESMLFDVKNEIYRVPDRLIDAVALFFNITDNSTAEKINQLLAQKKISEHQATQLTIIDGIAREIRLSTYFHYGRQNGQLSVMRTVFSSDLSAFKPSDHRHIERFYCSVIPLYDAVTQLCSLWLKQPNQTIQFDQKKSWVLTDDLTYVRLYKRLGKYELMQDRLALLVSKGIEIQKMDPFMLLELALCCYRAGEPLNAINCITLVLQQIEKNESRDDLYKAKAIALSNLSNAYRKVGQLELGKKAGLKAVQLCDRTFGTTSKEHASALGSLGLLYRELKQPSQALPILLQSKRLLKKLYIGPNPLIAGCYVNLGLVHYDLGNYPLARDYHQKGLEIELILFDKEHVEIASTLTSYSLVHIKLGEMLLAKSKLLRAVAIRKKYVDRFPLVAACTLNTLGCVHIKLGELAMARQTLEESVRLFDENTNQFYSTSRDELYAALTNLKNVYVEQKQPKLVKKMVKRIVLLSKQGSHSFFSSNSRLSYIDAARQDNCNDRRTNRHGRK